MVDAKKPGASGAPPANHPKLQLPGMKSSPPSRRALVKAVLAQLAARFPACFAGPGVAPRPLKLGIHADLRAAMPELSVHERKAALHRCAKAATHCPAAAGVLAPRNPTVDILLGCARRAARRLHQ